MAKHTRDVSQETRLESLQADLGRLTVEMREAGKRLEDKMMAMSQENNKSREELKVMFEIVMHRHSGKEPMIETG
jgi:hypothetical protein